MRKGEAELEVKSLTINKPPYKTLASKQTYNTYKILVSSSLRDRVKCSVLDGKGDINSLAIDRHIYLLKIVPGTYLSLVKIESVTAEILLI